jgi:hypothetical protein
VVQPWNKKTSEQSQLDQPQSPHRLATKAHGQTAECEEDKAAESGMRQPLQN